MTTDTGPPSSASSPISFATQATSHVDQLRPSPPHPAAAFSPAAPETQQLLDRAIAASVATTTADSSPVTEVYKTPPSSRSFLDVTPKLCKPHPADLVTQSNPDPHPDTPSVADSGRSSSPCSPSSVSDLRSHPNSQSVNDSNHEGHAENGILLSQGSEHGGAHGHDESEDGSYFPPQSEQASGDIAQTPFTNGRQPSRRSSSAIGPEDNLVPSDDETGAERSDDVLPPLQFVTGKTPLTSAKEAKDLMPPPSDSARRTSRGHVKSQSMGLPQLAGNGRSEGERTAPREATTAKDAGRGDKERKVDSSKRDKEREREKERESTRSRRVLGEWTMGKTLGAGSMGKVKLGVSNISGEKVAIKIIPRFTSTAAAHRPSTSSAASAPTGANGDKKGSSEKEAVQPTASFLQKAAAKDASKEVRTMREGSLCLLLHHPYICGMKSMLLYPHHYYMVCEYVNGGQMLDYIISHGRLRERSARKFARQIGSALEYCHANSIVHRDLKIENILISKTGNIKIIDFGLSNLYSPSSHLDTFCGSLYFAAPELLNAKLYTGPEVDVWSFGIVLYVLVCGKVPFDDQSMPALHAKIKRGQVEYPTWLSAECKHLLSRMLVTTPTQRATLAEVLNHPWVTKGFTGPPSPHLPPRVPIRLEDINREVIKGMIGFEFGTEVEIEQNLVEVVTSDLYRTTVRAWEAKRAGTGADGDPDMEKWADRPATRVDGKDMKGVGRSPTSKRFSGLGFYGKKLAGGFNAAFASAGKGDGEPSDGASNPSLTTLVGGVRPDQLDPTRGFHPLLSIYYLVKEKIEREKIWGPGVFASSTLSLTGPPPPPAPALAYQSGAGAMPHRAPDLAKPPSASTADNDTEVLAVTRQPVAIPLTPQPRQRATGDELPQHPSTAPAAVREGFRSSFSGGKRSSMHEASRPLPSYEPVSPSPQSRKAQNGDLSDETPLVTSTQGGFARRFGSLLGRSAPSPETGYKGHRQRASIGGTAHKASNKTAVSALPQVMEGGLHSGGSDVPLATPPEGQPVHRSSTVGELSPSRHQRGVSMGAGILSGAATLSRAEGAQIAERRRQISVSGRSEASPPTFDERQEELADNEIGSDERRQQDVGFVGRTASPSDGDPAKPVWLKGLFSVSTTSTKSIATIKADLVKVLDRLGVQHRDVKSGFECAHVPSIDLSTVGNSKKSPASTKGTVRKKASKLLMRDATSAADDSQVSLNQDTRERTQANSSTSFTVLAPVTPTDAKSPNPGGQNMTPPPPSRHKFNSSTLEGSIMSNDLIVRFEVFVVRMPLLPGMHGLQFRRIAGNAWQYQMLARRVLSELKL